MTYYAVRSANVQSPRPGIRPSTSLAFTGL